ncbi:MAG: tail protein X [Dysgonamonadaceae bacterium]|jgi:phage tail protein X|nr:tail protein X [Dysgonamonadaceae bacterium]
MDSLNYTTKDGDRIDTLANRFYGNNQGIQIIADANPDVPITAVYPIGTVLIIPIVDDLQFTNNDDLPPWKR